MLRISSKLKRKRWIVSKVWKAKSVHVKTVICPFLQCCITIREEYCIWTAAEMKYMRITAGYTWTDHKTNTQIAKELEITPILDKLQEYKRNWIYHVNRMPRSRLPRVMKQYFPTGRRNHGRPLKRLLDAWDRNGSTSGPIPWKMMMIMMMTMTASEVYPVSNLALCTPCIIFFLSWRYNPNRGGCILQPSSGL